MAPFQTNEGLKNSKIIKSLWKKFKSPKEKNKKNIEDELVCDSEPTPDYFYEDEPVDNTDSEPEQSKDTCDEKTSTKNKQNANKSEEEEGERQKSRKKKGTKEKQSEDPPTGITYNIHNVSGLQIGNTNISNVSYNIKQTYNAVPEAGTKSKKHVELTPEIRAVLQSSAKLDFGHMAFLSKHFGKSCREIGLVLELSSGQIDQIENDCGKDAGKMSFEILTLWMRNNGEKATIGRLCVKLWDSRIRRAREAVKHLSDNIDNFD